MVDFLLAIGIGSALGVAWSLYAHINGGPVRSGKNRAQERESEELT